MGKIQPCPNSWAYCALDLENSRALTDREKQRLDAKKRLEKPDAPETREEHFNKKLITAFQDSNKFSKE